MNRSENAIYVIIDGMTTATFQASKWVKIPMLIDVEEMENLLEHLGDFAIYCTSTVCEEGKESIAKQELLRCYESYVHTIETGRVPDESQYRHMFSSAFTTSSDHLYMIPVGDRQCLLRVVKPVVQLQPFYLNYSPIDGKFRSMVKGPDSVSWGIQFSYPQIYQNPKTKQIEKVAKTAEFPDTELFHRLQKWSRYNTIATPFWVKGQKINVPIRLGKSCLSWINQHPHLLKKGIQVGIRQEDIK